MKKKFLFLIVILIIVFTVAPLFSFKGLKDKLKDWKDNFLEIDSNTETETSVPEDTEPEGLVVIEDTDEGWSAIIIPN